MKTKKPELKFKMESVGIRPEEDDDLHLCPARTRPYWPKKIIPWWTASFPSEKPPYSYSTLIAYAILSSKDGRLTLNDIYLWISKTYPYFEAGKAGWQNSIRHNLSLNKKWFCKVDRRPTQANPGKGCYWTLIAGTEHIFIESLTEESSNNRKQNDIGLTAELSIGKRRGVCFYNDRVTPDYLETPPPTPTNPDTLKLTEPISLSEDSDNDSGVDVSNRFQKPRKRARVVAQDPLLDTMDQWLVDQSSLMELPYLSYPMDDKKPVTIHLNNQVAPSYHQQVYYPNQFMFHTVYPHFLPTTEQANALQFIQPSFINMQDYFYL